MSENKMLFVAGLAMLTLAIIAYIFDYPVLSIVLVYFVGRNVGILETRGEQ